MHSLTRVCEWENASFLTLLVLLISLAAILAILGRNMAGARGAARARLRVAGASVCVIGEGDPDAHLCAIVCLSVCLPVCPSVCPSVFLCVCVCVCVPCIFVARLIQVLPACLYTETAGNKVKKFHIASGGRACTYRSFLTPRGASAPYFAPFLLSPTCPVILSLFFSILLLFSLFSLSLFSFFSLFSLMPRTRERMKRQRIGEEESHWRKGSPERGKKAKRSGRQHSLPCVAALSHSDRTRARSQTHAHTHSLSPCWTENYTSRSTSGPSIKNKSLIFI